MIGDTLIRCQASAELKQALREAASREHVTEPAVLRRLLQTLTRPSSVQSIAAQLTRPGSKKPERDRTLTRQV